MELAIDLLSCAAAGAVGVSLAHYLHKYAEKRGWRGWFADH